MNKIVLSPNATGEFVSFWLELDHKGHEVVLMCQKMRSGADGIHASGKNMLVSLVRVPNGPDAGKLALYRPTCADLADLECADVCGMVGMLTEVSENGSLAKLRGLT